MTSLRTTLIAALAVAPVALPAAAQTEMTDDQAMMLERLQVRKAVTDAVLDAYSRNPDVVIDDEPGDPIQQMLTSGERLPEGVETGPVPDDLAGMLPMIDGAEWVTADDHLIALEPDGTARHVVWDILP
jgi:hypothetical protein